MGGSKFPRKPVAEGILFQIHRLIEDREFRDDGELNAYLKEITAKLNRGEELPPGKGTPAEKAQELVYDAWEAEEREERIRLARRALEIFPDCADAYVILAEDEAKTTAEAKDFYAAGVEAGERALGPEFFKKNKGEFWGILATRGYMRARQGLYQCLWDLGEKTEAIRHCQEMLRLNPNDNQGVRYDLAAYLLETRRLEELERLFRKYREDTTFWLYARALFHFLRGEKKKAMRTLGLALEANPFVPAYLLGVRQLPDEIPGFYSPGGEEEAVIYVVDHGACWFGAPEALVWLAVGAAGKLAEWAADERP